MKTRYDIATVSHDTVDDLVDTDPIALRDLAWSAITAARAAVGPEVRERLARHLYLAARGRTEDDRAFAAGIWDADSSEELRDAWRLRADAALEAIAGKED